MQHVDNFVPNIKKMNERVGFYCYKTDIGIVRKTNEDVAMAMTNASGDALLLVCDGMGGHNKGDVAANISSEVITSEFRKIDRFLNNMDVRNFLRKTVKKANKAVFDLANKDEKFSKMGTTLTLALIRKKSLFIVSVGDSRAYIIDDSVIHLTEDETYVNYLYHTNRIKLEDMDKHPQRNILTNALGLYKNLDFEIDYYRYNNNRVLLCSDGLYNSVSEEEMLTILTTSMSIYEKCDLLIDAAIKNGGKDNACVAVWEVQKDEY